MYQVKCYGREIDDEHIFLDYRFIIYRYTCAYNHYEMMHDIMIPLNIINISYTTDTIGDVYEAASTADEAAGRRSAPFLCMSVDPPEDELYLAPKNCWIWKDVIHVEVVWGSLVCPLKRHAFS